MFVHYYLISLNATKAAIEAGYSKKTARSLGQRLLTNADIQKAIAAGKEDREEKTKVDAEWVLVNLADMIKADPSDIIDEDTGAYKRIHDWPLVWRRMLSAADVQEIWETEGKNKIKVGEIVKYKFIDKLKAFELLGKHVDVSAFAERIDVHVNDDLADRIARGRNRTTTDETEKRVH